MHIILVYIIFNIYIPQDYGKADYAFNVIELFELEVSGDKTPLNDIDGITTDLEYFIHLSNLLVNVSAYKDAKPLHLFLYQPIRAPPILV